MHRKLEKLIAAYDDLSDQLEIKNQVKKAIHSISNKILKQKHSDLAKEELSYSSNSVKSLVDAYQLIQPLDNTDFNEIRYLYLQSIGRDTDHEDNISLQLSKLSDIARIDQDNLKARIDKILDNAKDKEIAIAHLLESIL